MGNCVRVKKNRELKLQNKKNNRLSVQTELIGQEESYIDAKIVLLGNSGVGKSSIALRYCHNQFKATHQITIGSAYLQKVVSVGSVKS